MTIGIDLVQIAKFKKIKKTDYKKWSKVFWPHEWERAFKKKGGEQLAGIFAAKEAAMKALGETSSGNFLDWELRWNKTGRPDLFFKHNKRKKISLSISHDAGAAVAAVLIV